MRPILSAIVLTVLVGPAMGQPGVRFDDFFLDKAMRVDLYLVGDAREELITLDRIVQEPLWPGSTTRLLDPFGFGHYAAKVYDAGSNRLIWDQGFESMFGEYKTTAPALAGVKRTFSRPVRFPYPKYPVRLVIERRDAQNILHPVFVHEFGHSFAGLADEYYQTEVSYNDFYPPGVEPLEPNISRYLTPGRLKWGDLVPPGLALPTDWGKDRIEAIQAEMGKNSQAMGAELERARQAGAAEADLAKIREQFKPAREELERRLAEARRPYQELEDKVGLFEGAGYTAKGMYRPMIYCIMIQSPKNEFCQVCQRAIRQMIDFVRGAGGESNP